MRKELTLLALLTMSSCSFTKTQEIPMTWSKSSLIDPQATWQQYNKTGTFDIDHFFDDMYDHGGSQYDGDCPLYTSWLLIPVEVDPCNKLNEYISSPDPYKRCFGILVAGYIGDRRFYHQLKKLQNDKSELKGYFTPTVGQNAEFALCNLINIHPDISWINEEHTANWLKNARHIEIDDQIK